MNSHTQCRPRQRRPAWRLAGCPTMLACRNRDLGTPVAGERHEERGGRTIEVAAAMVARRLPAACRATRLCCNVMRVGGVGSPELQGIRGCGWLRQKADPSRYLPAIARQCGEKRCQVKPLHWLCRTQRVRLRGDRDLVFR